MKKFLLLIGFLALCQMTFAQPNTRLKPDQTVLLYSQKMTGKTVDPVVARKVSSAGYKMVQTNDLSGVETINAHGALGNISSNARIDLYFPKNPNGQMVIVCPGGGYYYVSSYNEGVYVADWMLQRGITVAVLKYRLPNGHWEVPLEDVQNAFRYCRSKAGDWGVKQIGVMGFSAGGHLAVSASVMYTDKQTRPDFSIFIYPVVTMESGITHEGSRDQLIGSETTSSHRELVRKYSLENQVAAGNPPTFLVFCTDDDVVPAENSIRLYRALVDEGVSVEMHAFPKGGHGWGFSTEKFVGEGNDWFAYARKELDTALERWLQSLK